MSKKVAISPGSKVGLLTIIEKGKKYKNKSTWVCKCDCGNELQKTSQDLYRSLRTSSKISCGCTRFKVNIGDKFHFLTVLKKLPTRKISEKQRSWWLCECTLCGNLHETTTDKLKRERRKGEVKSCGCAKNIIGIPHTRISAFSYLRKTCPRCNKDQPRCQFGLDLSRPGGLKSFCKKCVYQSKDRAKVIVSTTNRKKRVKRATPNWVSSTAFLEIYRKKQELEGTLNTVLNVDHIIPLIHPNFCGLHVPWNLQVTTQHFNLSKQNNTEYINWEDPSIDCVEIDGILIHKSVFAMKQ
jgi:hypothetical protein